MLRVSIAIVAGLALVGGVARGADGPVDVAGRVTFDGPIPEAVKNPEAGVDRPFLEVDRETKGLKGVVVWLEGVESPGPGPGDEPVVIDQAGFEFVPRIVAVRAEQTVEFRNSDTANHGVTGASVVARNRFSLTTPPGGAQRLTFAASKYPIAIGCPVHAAMSAWVFVFDHGWFAVTDETGSFRLAGVPPGRYRLEVRQPDGGFRRSEPIEVRAGMAETKVGFTEADLSENVRR